MLIVYDLDETLTDKNGGNSISEAWYTRENYNEIKNMLHQQKQKGHTLFVVSRGVRMDVIRFLNESKLFSFFEGIIGAKSIKENRDRSAVYWGKLKTRYLKELTKVYGNNIVFVDDNLHNILPARKAGFRCIHVNPPGSKSTVALMKKWQI